MIATLIAYAASILFGVAGTFMLGMTFAFGWRTDVTHHQVTAGLMVGLAFMIIAFSAAKLGGI